MATTTSIEWTDKTWNPVTGCSKISPGCKHCYAARMATRLQAMGMAAYRNGFEVTVQPSALEIPLRWRKPARIFVNSMSDLYHDAVPDEYIGRVFDVMARAPRHQFQILTKRPERLLRLAEWLRWTQNIWQGVSVENADYLHRVDLLRQVPSAVRFLSIEPLLGPLDGLDLGGIDWVIVGGESGPRARPMEAGWVRTIRDRCADAGVAFFFKQWGGRNKKASGRCLDGRTHDEMPFVHGQTTRSA